ncbi:MMPL family transporter [uncultured Gemmiger sp.]|uniref:efflux RND transporter permease subunit n=1 Tax=uncultured Gemmiger sp. TaxID=1623490 RepID=UPI0025F7A5B8|nr:MMPL family transporter [uncultured Gemmiger sp.]
MEEQKPKGSGMEKIATFIVDKRNLFFLLYAFALIFSIVATGWVKVENDITTYLPEDTETRQGLTVMNDNFVTYGTARVMVSNVTYETAENICSDLESIDGVTSVDFDDTTDHYKSASALFSVTFDGTTTDDISVHALHTIRDMLAGYDTYIDTEVGVDTSADLQSEMSVILVLAAIVIVLVLTLTSRSYAEVPVLIMTFGAAALLNMGTNFLCGTISFISNSVTVILQLALAIDYAIILCHRFSDEHETKDTREACIAALSKAIPEISSSSLTTISGLGALAFMHFGIGRDMATVLIKAILFSLLSVFTLMPGLLMVFSKKIDATRHKNLIPKITFLGKFDVATRFIVPPIFAVVVVVTAVLANKCPYCYSYTDLVTAKQSESQIAHQKIKNTFGVNNMVAVIVPTGDYDSERQLLKDLDSCAEVKSTQGLANIDAMDGYKLADALTPRQMSELAGLDYEVAEALYAAYAVDQNEYGKLISGLGDYKVPLFDMFMFLQREMKDGNITLDGDIQETLDDLFGQLNKAQLQLQSDKYSRLVVYLNLPEESDETMDFLDTMHALIAKYYSSDTYIVGNSTNVKDLSSSFGEDNMLISVLSALFVVIILLFTFKSAGLPVLLIVVIQGSIWINFSVPTIQHESLYFLGYLIVNSIQMGANIDYAIVISSHYSDLKKEMRPKEAIIAALNEAFPTIFTSGTILAVAGALIGVMTTNPVIAAIGTCLGRGTVISIVLVMAVLPQILLIGDTIVERTSFDVKVPVDLSRVNRTANGNMRVSGRVRGYVNGVIDAEIKGTLNGTLNASVTSGTTIEPTKPDFYLPESKEQAAAEWAENYTEGEEV